MESGMECWITCKRNGTLRQGCGKACEDFLVFLCMVCFIHPTIDLWKIKLTIVVIMVCGPWFICVTYIWCSVAWIIHHQTTSMALQSLSGNYITWCGTSVATWQVMWPVKLTWHIHSNNTHIHCHFKIISIILTSMSYLTRAQQCFYHITNLYFKHSLLAPVTKKECVETTVASVPLQRTWHIWIKF